MIEADQLRISNAVKQIDELVDVLRVDQLSPPADCERLLTTVGSAVDSLARAAIA